MTDFHDLELLVHGPTPILLVESNEERRVIEAFATVAAAPPQLPLFVWSVSEGLRRHETGYSAQKHNAKPFDVLSHIKCSETAGIYLLLDFHPYLQEPLHVRLLKEIALEAEAKRQTIALASHAIEPPPELRGLCARYRIGLPDAVALEAAVREEAAAWGRGHGGARSDAATVQLFARNLAGLTMTDARRLARRALQDDGALTAADVPAALRAKHELLDPDGVLQLVGEGTSFEEVGGLRRLRDWLGLRRAAFLREGQARGLDVPRGILLLGVQGCGKSLAAKATAGAWGVPLLRLDFGRLYDKYIGETEHRLDACLRACDAMAPCVLWVDEIEKGLAIGDQDGGTAHRVLGMLLTWMAENRQPVFVVATCNDVRTLPPELVRKGRLDEIFFVDLPGTAARQEILAIHLRKRSLDPAGFDLAALAGTTAGFSGAELEQAVVGALYAAHAERVVLTTSHVAAEVRRTRPLAVVMAERVGELRAWARDRTVPAD